MSTVRKSGQRDQTGFASRSQGHVIAKKRSKRLDLFRMTTRESEVISSAGLSKGTKELRRGLYAGASEIGV